MGTHPNTPPNLEGLAKLLVLQDQVKNLANLKEFGYFVTNETHRLIHYNTAYLWKKGEAIKIQILDQSEVAEVDLQSPAVQWLKEAIEDILKIDHVEMTQALNFEKEVISNETENKGTENKETKDKGIENREINNKNTENKNTENKEAEKKESYQKVNAELSDRVMLHWPKTLPKYLLWCPFLNEVGLITGGLILFREIAFSEQEVKMFNWLGKTYQYTWKVLTHSKLSFFYRWTKDKPYIKVLLFILVIGLLMPTRMSVVANATVESSNPAPINAPIAGIIKEFLVKPGDNVKSGQLLLVLDKNDLIKAVAIAQKKVLLTSAKLRSATNQGYDKAENRDEIPIWQAELAVDQSELEYTQSMLQKTDIYSPINGVAVFESKEDWVGQPVQAGENLMNIEDPTQLQLDIFLPVTELINLEVGAEGDFFVYGQLRKIPVTLTSVGYNAKLTSNKILAYQFKAKFVDPNTAPRIGSQGTVRLYGHKVPFIYFLLRRPLQALRQTFGF